jgi:hypothetical protein
MSRRFAAPRRGVRSPPGQELLGVVTSHGPSRESYRSSRKSRRSAKAFDTPAAYAALSAERMRPALSSPAGAPAVLQRALPGGGAEMVAVEGAATIPGDDGGQTETQRPKPGQSQRYRKRVRSRKPPEPEAVGEAARVITKKFFRGLLRPARLLREIPAPTA